MLINGNEPLNLSTLRDILYPIDMQFVFPSGFDPITNIGGNWSLIAEDVSLPIGNKIFVNPYPTEHRITGYGVRFKITTGETLKGIAGIGIDSSGILYTDGGNNMTGSNYITPAFSNLYAELSTAEYAQTVSIWKRTADEVD